MKFPMKFEVEASAGPGLNGPWTARSNHLAPIACAIPPEFMGPGGGYSPEDFFALAVLNCVIAMHKVYCDKSGVSFSTIQGKAVLTVNKEPSVTTFVMSHVELTFTISGASDPAKARSLLEAAIRDCPVSNSIKSSKTFHIQID
jgi:organic hydroperoxide reductase OsmC/OhrA